MRSGLMVSAWLLGLVLGAFAPGVAALPASTRTQPADMLPTPQFRRYETSDGLPSSTVYAVVQDHDGFMWFGAGPALVRFDGVDFHTFSHHADDPNSLAEGLVYNLFVDRDNRLWVCGHDSGLSRYDAERHGFIHWSHDVKDARSLSDDKVWAATQTPNGDLWVATDAGLDRLLPDGVHFEHVTNPLARADAPGFGSVRALLAEADGKLWIGSSQGLFVREVDGNVRRVAVDPRLATLKVWRIQGGGNDVRVAVRGGLLRIGADRVARLAAHGQIPAIDVYSSTLDQAGDLWIATRDGLYLDDGRRIHKISEQPLLLGSLPAQQVWQSLCDREGGLWFVMGDGGIAYLAPGWSEFTRFTHVPDDANSLRDVAATAVLAGADGKLWVGGRGLVDKLDPMTGQVQHLVSGLRGAVLDMVEDAARRLWIVSEGSVYRYAAGKLAQVDLSAAHATHPRRLAPGPDGQMYLVSLHDGLFRIDADTLVVDPTPLAPTGETGFLANRLGTDGTLGWYTYDDKLLRWNARRAAFDAVDGLAPGSPVFALDQTVDGFWAARNDGLEHYRVDGHRVERDKVWPLPASWPPMMLIAIHVDKAGRFWLFCKNGLWRFDPGTQQLRTFGLRNGLVNSEVRGDSPTRAPDGTIYAASLGGVFGFQPDRPPTQAGRPLLVISAVSVRRDGHIRALSTRVNLLRLGWADRELRVATRLSSYADPSANHYRFRLLGFDSNWVDTGSHGEREYTGLGAGNYTLEVSAAGADGQWTTLNTPLRISVGVPPWLRWWAWVVYVLLGMLLVGSLLRMWRRRLAVQHHLQLLEQQRRMAEAASAAKSEFLATLSHEIRTPMTGVLGMAELLLGTPLTPVQHDYTRTMQRSGSMLLKLLNDALDLARIEAGRLELEPVSFSPRELLDEVMELERGLAQLKGIHLALQVADNFPARVVGDPLRIKQVLLNLANNALKFTERGSVKLSAQRMHEGLWFSVSDTGPGIPEASQARMFQRFEQVAGPQRAAGSGLGLAICRELVSVMGGSIELQSRVGGGSTFHVRLPLVEPPPTSVSQVLHVDTGRPCHLLLVEDDSIVAAVIRGLLEGQGHSVCHVVNGLAALAEMARVNFDALLLDLDLPGVDGFQVARLIRQREHAPQRVPIVAVTARASSEDEVRARAVGMDGFLRKPLTGEQLADALARVLSASPA